MKMTKQSILFSATILFLLTFLFPLQKYYALSPTLLKINSNGNELCYLNETPCDYDIRINKFTKAYVFPQCELGGKYNATKYNSTECYFQIKYTGHINQWNSSWLLFYDYEGDYIEIYEVKDNTKQINLTDFSFNISNIDYGGLSYRAKFTLNKYG